MSRKNDQAWPVAACNGHTPGMTLREWYAGMALQGLCGNQEYATIEEGTIAKWAKELADAMLIELAEEPRCADGGE